MEFMRQFPDDAACLDHLWRTRYAPDGERAHCPKCDQERSFKRYATSQARQSWTCTLRPPSPSDRRDDLREVLDLAAPLVLRDVSHG